MPRGACLRLYLHPRGAAWRAGLHGESDQKIWKKGLKCQQLLKLLRQCLKCSAVNLCGMHFFSYTLDLLSSKGFATVGITVRESVLFSSVPSEL